MPKFDFLKKTLTKFAKDEKGSFAILFALVAVILIFAAGTAIDYTRAINEQDRMQRAIDAAVLAGATQSQTISDTDAIEQAALDVFNINYQVSSGTTIEAPTFTYSPTQRELVGTINGTVPTTLSRVMGIETIDVGVNATASLGVTRVEYVLAIDQSGSMKSNGRQAALIDGLEDFRDILTDTLQFGDEAYIGVVPWQTTVNIGTHRRDWVFNLDRPRTQGLVPPFNNIGDPNNLEFLPSTRRENVLLALSSFDFAAQGFEGYEDQTELDELDDLFDGNGNGNGNGNGPPNINPSDYPDLSWRGCVLARDVDDTIPIDYDQNYSEYEDTDDAANLAAPESVLRTPSNDDDKFRAYYQPPRWGENGLINTWIPFGNHTEDENDDTRNPNLGCNRQEIQYFVSLGTNSTAVLDNVIAGLDPEDDVSAHTDSSLGMIWALRMMDPEWRDFWNDPSLPDDVPAALDNSSRKVIILLTDGRNGIGSNTLPETRSAYADASKTLHSSLDNNSGNRRARATDILDLRTLRLCQLAKNLGVEVYTIGLDLDPDDSGESDSIEMLANCASEPTAEVPSYAILADADGLATAFAQIARQEPQILLTD